MENTNSVSVKEQKETELEKWAASHIKMGDKWTSFREDDPFLKKKLEDAIKFLEENPLPDWLIKRMMGKD